MIQAIHPKLGNIRSNTISATTSDVVSFYDEATVDYEYWSKSFNMHFGYFRWFKTNPFNRDAMLNEMNHQVLKRLNLIKKKGMLVDLGCGMGGTMRYALLKNKNLSSIGITLSNFQVNKGNILLRKLKGLILQENYNSTSLPASSCDGAIAIESFCHGGHHPKSFKEAFRILKPEGRLVIADAFLKKMPDELSGCAKNDYSKICTHWSLKKLGAISEIQQQLKNISFSKVKIEEISLNVGPSVLHVPFAIVGFVIKMLFRRDSFKKARLHNLKGSFYALLCGLHLKSFGYYLITCVK